MVLHSRDSARLHFLRMLWMTSALAFSAKFLTRCSFCCAMCFVLASSWDFLRLAALVRFLFDPGGRPAPFRAPPCHVHAFSTVLQEQLAIASFAASAAALRGLTGVQW